MTTPPGARIAAVKALLVGAFSFGLWRSHAAGRALPIFGFVVAAYQLVNSAAPWTGTPDAATLPGHIGFAAWMTWCSVVAWRTGSQATPATGLSASRRTQNRD